MPVNQYLFHVAHQATAAAAQANLIRQQEELERKAAELDRKEQELQNRSPGGSAGDPALGLPFWSGLGEIRVLHMFVIIS